MINIQQQEVLFNAIGNILQKKIELYAIGGTSMMLRGIKDATLDVDFVFDNNEDRNEIISALRRLRAKESDVTLIYGSRDNTPEVLELDNVRFDLFMNKIITSIFSEKMKERAKQAHEFGRNLVVKAADYHDVIIMKCVTSRTKDLDDISLILNKRQINWETILDAAKEQVDLGNEMVILSLGEKFEIINRLKKAKIPMTVLDDLWKLLNKQVE